MSEQLTFSDPKALADLHTFLQRASRVNNSSARVISGERFLQVYVGILVPRGLLDKTPTVLGLRVSALQDPVAVDSIVPIEALLHRLHRAEEENVTSITLPAEVPSLAWAAITPPRDNWRRRRSVASSDLSGAAQLGIQRVAEAIPGSSGEAIVQKVRSEVWGELVPHTKRIPAGAALAADALGFLKDHPLLVHTNGPWLRLTATEGYVLVKMPTGHDFGPEEADD